MQKNNSPISPQLSHINIGYLLLVIDTYITLSTNLSTKSIILKVLPLLQLQPFYIGRPPASEAGKTEVGRRKKKPAV
jgi:hypothetical protein